ncbi:LOW QUALITY PROTEIN: uncharacterized protein ppp1r3ab [Morone saxatilis]|uniref:LOW QUALITY PROTEIN: uncharacterized protein ppp1r3ab n=1 Tax=Morone saxatilis TaxID=34816 RepID=UPI0015E1D9F4|nr:LOW QUALITY PROTEIN: uncharacterized protein ppp1r3ab [Morone saxatilis]
MSSVTRLHLVSQSMLNVSCQKQKQCSSLPADSFTESPMEFVGQQRPSEACGLLGVPGLSILDLDLDDDEGEVVIGIRPKSSPLPRRKSSISDEELDPEPPLCGSRRVSFADSNGLSLVHVKEFGTWDVPKLPGYESSESECKDEEEYFLSPFTFSLPLSTEELFVKVRDQKVELENIELLPGTTILRGMIRVLNISFTKAVYVRTTLDTWSTHFDLLAEYIPGSSDNLTDCFSFKLTLVPPFGEQGARVDFCLRYETPVGTFWANNNDRNYVLFCHQGVKERKEKQQKEIVNKKSCLKIVSQNFSTMENISAVESSSQENISTDVSKHVEKVDTVKAKQISDGQSGPSEEDGQKLLTESQRNCSRRNRRKAARMARVRDLFAQKIERENDTERDGSPPEAKQAAQEETPEEEHSDVQSFPEGSSNSDGSLVSESLETCSEPILDVLHDMSPAHDNTPNSEPKKSESISLAALASLTGNESATDIKCNLLHSNDEPATAECHNINKSDSKADGSSQRQSMSYKCTGNIAAKPADSIISAVSDETLVSNTNNLTFGTVVAPLYHQVFGRLGSESQSVGDWGNPVRGALNVGDLTQSYPRTERRETSCIVPKDTGGNNDKVQTNVKTQKSNQECLDATSNHPPIEETGLTVTANHIQDHAETLQEIIHSDKRCTNTSDVPEIVSGDTVVHLNTDLLNSQIPNESLHLQGEAQEDNLTHDLTHDSSQTTAETAWAQLPEHTCIQIKTNLDETCAQSETQEVMTGPKTTFMSLNDFECVDEPKKDNEVDKTVTVSTTNAFSEEDKLLEPLHNLILNHTGSSDSNETGKTNVTCFEIVEEKDVTKPLISLETHDEKINNVEEENKEANNSHNDETKQSTEIEVTGEVAESMPKAMMSNHHIHSDMFVELKDEDTVQLEIIVSGKVEHLEIEADVSKCKGFCLADTVEVKNWEMMVEEEEKNILTDGEEREAASSKAEGTEAVEKDQGEQLDDARIETASENRDTTQTEIEKTGGEMVVVITAAREKENQADNADALEDKWKIGGKQIGEIVVAKNRKEVEKELEYVQEKTAEEGEVAEGTEVEAGEEQEETELGKGKHFTETQKVSVDRTNIQEESDEAGMEWEDRVKPEVENVEEENPDYREEILVDEMGESEILDAKSESVSIEDRENEVECLEERADIIQNKVEDDLSARVNNVQEKRVIDKENTGEWENAHTLSGMHLYKEEDFRNNGNVTHDLSKAARDENESAAAEGSSCVFADGPESDQLSHDSASADSDSGDEVELYMHCLRAVHTGPQVHKDRNKDTGFSVGKRPSVSRSKLLSTPMPSISESLDEEQSLNRLQDNHEDTETADIEPTFTALPASSTQESINRNVSWWIETFSCSNISKTLLYATLLVVFLVVAYHYDFLACFGLYLISLIWLCCHGERQTGKNNNRLG